MIYLKNEVLGFANVFITSFIYSSSIFGGIKSLYKIYITDLIGLYYIIFLLNI